MCGEIKNTVAAIIDPDLPIKWMTRVYRRVCAPFMVWIDNNVRGGVFGVRGKGGMPVNLCPKKPKLHGTASAEKFRIYILTFGVGVPGNLSLARNRP